MIYNRADDDGHRLVDAYAAEMKDELDANFYKGDRDVWSEWSLGEALAEIRYHLEKLEMAIEDKEGTEKIREYCADIGNCAMFVADITGAIKPVEPKQPEPPSYVRNTGPDYHYDIS